jgi:hypothetical protein
VAVTLPVAGQQPYDVTLNTAISSIDTTVTGHTASIASNTARLVVLENPTINLTTGTTYTLVTSDMRNIVHRSNAASNTCTLPPTAGFAIGDWTTIRQWGAGVTTIAAGSGVTIRSAGGALAFANQYASLTASITATNEWLLEGYVT